MSAPRSAAGAAHAEVPARAALVGNPSDGFGGATIALALPALRAMVAAEAASGVAITGPDARIGFADAAELVAAARAGAYPPGGPLALAMAAAKRLFERAQNRGVTLEGLGFRLDVSDSTIPAQVGLAGSSAIVVGVLRALGTVIGDELSDAELPRFALACETEELGVAAGLQDRVVQTHGGLVFMDFDPTHPEGGRYEWLDPTGLPKLLVAWLDEAAAHSGHAHQTVAERHARGDLEVVETMAEIASLAHAARRALAEGDHAALGALMSRNFDLRRRIYSLDPRHTALIECARDHGLHANYTGSGGAIVAVADDAAATDALARELEELGCGTLRVNP